MRQSFLQKMMGHTPAFVGAMVILVMTVLAVLAYVIIDDKSPGANEQNLEIALKPAGFKTKYIRLTANIPTEQNRLKRYFFGQDYPYKRYPIKKLLRQGEEFVVLSHFDQEKIIQKTSLYDTQIRERMYLLGTDKYGRSIFSRIVLGIRVSLLVGFFAVLISITIGVLLGALAGYFGGVLDRIIMYLVNVMWSIPTLILVFAVVLAFGRGLGTIFLAVGLTMWVDVARIVRGQVKQVREELYVQAARSVGLTDVQVIWRYILPNIIGPILVIAAANFATAILIEAGLSYLGFGVKPPTSSIGNILNENYGYAVAGKPMLAFIPALVIILLVLSFNILGNGLRDIFDVRDRK